MFINYWFIVFISLFFPVFWLFRVVAIRKVWLLSACLLFQYQFATAAGMLPILILGVLTYFAAISPIKKIQTGVIIACVSVLVFYKYSIFLVTESIRYFDPRFANAIIDANHQGWLSLTPPLAVSFFVFEFIHYLVDVQRGRTPMTSLLDFALFASFWPSVVAGPIKRFEQFIPALSAGCHQVTLDDVKTGTLRITMGLIKKLVFADNLTGYIDYWQPQFASMSFTARWLLVVAISLRILFDFSGYTDIAIGCARLMGIKLPENFNWPYLAVNLQEFWRRWHMSLSTWLRDYIYIPLGGSQRGVIWKIRNGLVVFALCGLWHGAGWNFIFWGIYHGIGYMVSQSCKINTTNRAVMLLSWLITFVFISIGWLYFFYPVLDANMMVKHLLWIR